MPTPPAAPTRLRTARVLRVREGDCEIWDDDRAVTVAFAPVFPTPRQERVSPGHLVAVATDADGSDAVVWRWFDAVVVGAAEDGRVRLWEPAHGEFTARPRDTYRPQPPGSRAYASAGLPGADWWVAARVDDPDSATAVELGEVRDLFDQAALWPAVFAAADQR